MLTDEADWNARTWDLQPRLLPGVALALLFIFERAPEGYVFEAFWAGDEPKVSLNKSLDEILDIVQKNQIGTATQYIVRAA